MQHSAVNYSAMAYRRVECCAIQESSPEGHLRASTPLGTHSIRAQSLGILYDACAPWAQGSEGYCYPSDIISALATWVRSWHGLACNGVRVAVKTDLE